MVCARESYAQNPIGVTSVAVEKSWAFGGVADQSSLKSHTVIGYEVAARIPAAGVTLRFEFRRQDNSLIFSQDVPYPKSILENTNDIYWNVDAADLPDCLADGQLYFFRTIVDPNDAILDLDPAFKERESAQFEPRVYLGQMVFGDVLATVDTVTSYDPATHAFRGSMTWTTEGIAINGDVEDLILSRDVLCRPTVTSGKAAFEGALLYGAGDWSYKLTSGELTATGATADVSFLLPPDTLFRRGPDVFYSKDFARVARVSVPNTIALPDVFPLDAGIKFRGEDLPFEVINTGTASWNSSIGITFFQPTLKYQHADAIAELGGAPLRSQDSLFANAMTAAGNTASITATGGLAVTVNFASGSWKPGFPSGVDIGFTSASAVVSNSKLASGSLAEAFAVLTYGTGACGGAAATAGVLLTLDNAEIAADGAVRAVRAPAATPVSLAFDAYSVSSITGGTVYAPGFSVFGTQTILPSSAPADYLLAGRISTGTSEADFATPGESGYINGLGSYAGFTLEAADLSGKSFTAQLACSTPVSLSFSTKTKLYGRASGFSGTLDAASGLPTTLQLFGDYGATISRFNITLLDSLMDGESHIDGDITLPFPSLISIPFSNLAVSKCGAISGAVAEPDTAVTLAYWNADLAISGFSFKPTNPPQTLACGVEKRTLWVKGALTVPNLSKPVLLEANLLPTGDVAGASIAGTGAIALDGWSMSVRKMYLSKWNGSTNPDGLVVIAGDVSLPFWGATPVKALVDAGGGLTLRDGRLLAQNPPVNDDANTDGFPDGSGISSLSAYAASAPYHVIVKGAFGGLMKFNYPVVYNTLTKSFRSPAPIDQDFVVISTKSQVPSITKDKTELRVGANVSTLPSINLSQLASNYANGAVSSFLGTVQGKLDTAGADLGGKLTKSIRPSVQSFLTPYANTYVANVETTFATVPAGPARDATLAIHRANFIASIQTPLRNYLRGQAGFTSPVQARATAALNAIDSLDTYLRALDSNSVYSVIQGIVQVAAAIPQPSVQTLAATLAEANVARAALAAKLQQTVRPSIDDLKAQVANAGGVFSSIDAAFADTAAYNAAINSMAASLDQHIAKIKATPDLAISLTGADIAEQITGPLLNSAMFAAASTQFSAALAPLRDQLQAGTLAYFDILNSSAAQYIDQAGAPLNKAITAFNNAPGFRAAKIDGHAVFLGDQIDRLHIGAEFAIKAPDDVTFNGAFSLQRKTSGATGQACGVPAGGTAWRGTIQANQIPIKFPGGTLSSDIEVFFTIQETGGNVSLRNAGGSIDSKGAVTFAAMQLIDPAFGVGIGPSETYLYFVGKAKLEGYGAKGGAFFGTTCDGLKILQKIDPEVAQVLKVEQMNGVYVIGEAAIPIIDYGCALRAGASVGAAFWLFVTPQPQYGAKLTAGVYGQAACLVAVKGRLAMIGAKDTDGYVLAGNAWLAGGVGGCDPETWFTPADVFDDNWCYPPCVVYVNAWYRPKVPVNPKAWDIKYKVKCF